MTSLNKIVLFTTITLLLRYVPCSVPGSKNHHNNKIQKVNNGLKCHGAKSCMNTALCGSNNVTYSNSTQFSKAKTHHPDLQLLHPGNCTAQTITLNDIFIAVKTSKKFEKSRMKIVLKTWFALARGQTWFFTDSATNSVYVLNKTFTRQHVINTNCSDTHEQQDLCCKTAVEFEYYMKSGKKWFCRFDDDNYVNVPRLLKVLQRFDPNKDWYLGRSYGPSAICARTISEQVFPAASYIVTFAHYGAGVCFSKSLVKKMIPHIAKGQLGRLCAQIACPDDVTIGYIVGHLAGHTLTQMLEFHSHTENLEILPPSALERHVTFSFLRDNVINIKGFNTTIDPTRLFSLHCHLFPSVKFCPKKA